MSIAVPKVFSKLSADAYSRLAETTGCKDELIEGERVLAPMPKFSHTVVLDNLEALIRPQFPEDKVVREAGWRFQSVEGLDNVPGPDLMVLRSEDYEKAARSGGYFEGHPIVIVEVISPSERKSRRLQKVGLYLEAGAGAIVEIDYLKHCAFIHRPEEDAAQVVRDRISWPFLADLSDIFRCLG